jgi:hypothetical protein
MGTKKELSQEKSTALLEILKTRFEKTLKDIKIWNAKTYRQNW